MPQQGPSTLGAVSNPPRPGTLGAIARVMGLQLPPDYERMPLPKDGPPETRMQQVIGFLADVLKGAVVGTDLGPDARIGEGVGMIAGMVPIGAGIRAVKGTLGGAARSVEGPAIRAYHGSPYDFDKFSLEKIGTGEGAQAYGHGLYFAENPQVASHYRGSDVGRTALATNPSYDVAGSVVTPQSHEQFVSLHTAANAQANQTQAFDDHVRDLAYRFKRASENPVNTRSDSGRKYIAELQGDYEFAKSLKDKPVSVVGAKGRTYEVAIKASPDDFLDWDKPLSPKSVDAVLKSLGDVRPVKMGRGYGVTIVGPDGVGKAFDVGGADSPEHAMAMLRASFQSSGDTVYRMMTGMLGGDAAASAAMKKAGIKGIRYKDAGSRGAEGGTSNYVVFDDAIIDIMKKYGVAFPVAAAMLAKERGNRDNAR